MSQARRAEGLLGKPPFGGIPLGGGGGRFVAEGPGGRGRGPRPHPRVFLPQWVGSDFEARDVELKQAIARVSTEDGSGQFPVSGRLNLRLALRLPLGTLDDLEAYRGEGTAELTRATIGSLSLGHLAGRLNLADGLLDVTDIRGLMVERTNKSPPALTETRQVVGPLPAGGFRGRFRTNLKTPGHAEAQFEGHQLPLSALASSAQG